MNALVQTLPPDHQDVPAPLSRLVDMAYNVWWTWHRDARRMFESIAPDIWRRYRNPVRVLLLAKRSRLAELAEDADFLANMNGIVQAFEWETQAPPADTPHVAYVSAEYALHESLPIYSGGLGVLSGDHLKEAADMRLPLVAVGLFYRRGYFNQLVDADGNQQHNYPELDAMRLPLLRVKGPDGKSLRVSVELGGRRVVLRAWCVFVGHVPLILLDSFSTKNSPEDHYITSQLYVRGRDMRLEQEIVLGRGAVAVLDALGIEPSVFHMNEGHSAFLALENLRRRKAPTLQAGIEAERPRHVFTTHTPVPAGNEVFEVDKVRPYLEATAQELGLHTDELLSLGEAEGSAFPPGFNLTALALRMSRAANGVSRLHAETSRGMWPQFEIGGVTNGIHVGTWLGREMESVLRLGGNEEPAELASRVRALDDAALWAAHVTQKHRLMRLVRARALRQAARQGNSPADLRRVASLLNQSALTLGFARRFAPYKRHDLLFQDPARIERMLCHADRPVQLIMAGKAHPADRAGQDIIRRIWKLAASPRLRGRIVFVENYDMDVARLMVRGVDVWLNTPTWPMEASGTSGMKAAANGVLNASVPDGWWAEGYAPGLGFNIGEAVAPDALRDSGILLDLIENDLVPLYYERGEDGLPRGWIKMMRDSMATFIERFSTRRMLTEYARDYYNLPGFAPAGEAQPATPAAG
jgi:starch phosphorylase